jgi:endonuclease/exonuclease/phosphatase (EEP) superfamily protein YafD
MAKRKSVKTSTPKPEAKLRPKPILFSLTALYASILFFGAELPADQPLHSLVAYAPPQMLCIPLAIASIIALPLLFRRGHRALALVTILCAVLSALHTYQYQFRAQPTTRPTDLRVLTCNFLFLNKDVSAITKYIIHEKIDLIYLQENEGGDQSPAVRIHAVLTDYHLFRKGSTAILSRFPISNTEAIQQKSLTHRYILAADIDGPIKFRAMTLHWSVPQITGGLPHFFRSVKKQTLDFELTNTVLDQQELPVLLGGDFNNPPRHAFTKSLSKRLTNAFQEVGNGFGFTFSSDQALTRIDHLYSSRELIPIRCVVGPSFGSDHFSLRTDYTLAKL